MMMVLIRICVLYLVEQEIQKPWLVSISGSFNNCISVGLLKRGIPKTIKFLIYTWLIMIIVIT